MAEIEITLPTVQYGNVKAKFSPEEFGLQPTDQLVDPTALGIAIAVYLNLFTQGFKLGSQMDVAVPSETASKKAPSGAVSAPVKAPQMPGVEEAARLLDEGLGGVTELSEREAADELTRLGQELDKQGEAPWKQPSVDSQPKPWETDVTAPAVLDEAW